MMHQHAFFNSRMQASFFTSTSARGKFDVSHDDTKAFRDRAVIYAMGLSCQVTTVLT